MLSACCEKLFVIQEDVTKISKTTLKKDSNSILMKKYFNEVMLAQKNIFKKKIYKVKKENTNIISIQEGELNKLCLSKIDNFLKSDIYIVYGSSYIKGDLVEFLIKKKAINIHLGVSPYYRGTACNFWAVYDNNPQYVGATIHLLSKGLDSGAILYHVLSNNRNNVFEYTMSTALIAFNSIVEKIKNQSLLKIEAEPQDRSKEIRYSKNKDFTDEIVMDFYKNKNFLNQFEFKKNEYKDLFLQ